MHGMWLHRAALYASAQFSRPTIRFLIILFLVCATLEVVTSQDSFVSINCGASQEQNSTSGFFFCGIQTADT
ncbi:hypothetical protein KP509_10G014800 [Ceratopteris richardii]|uniref:Uncharacterized protein n=1 Tax=Ceratopteris richardii TaxID=49495 RepID=A0A8T2TWE3_CERRI|nr:hypothetical protein KP509_10G014800 [Ceratopteris richardii]